MTSTHQKNTGKKTPKPQNPYTQSVISAVVILTSFVMLGIGTVAVTYQITAPKIKSQELQKLLSDLNALIPSHVYNNNFSQDVIKLNDPLLGNAPPYQGFRARMDNTPKAIVIEAETKTSYSGTPIKFLVGILANGEIAGVRVLPHKETPGMGDGIMSERSDWALAFTGKSLNNTAESDWAVKKDGGTFDQFTGATITPRAVVHGVHDVLTFHKSHQQKLFELTTTTSEKAKK